MTPTGQRVHEPPSAHPWNRRLRGVTTGLFCLLFIYNGVWTFVDPEDSRRTLDHLGFPVYFAYPLGIAELLGIAVIVWGRSRTLTGFAFAGFLYELLLALLAHFVEGDPDIWLVLLALMLWAGAFWADRQRFSALGARTPGGAPDPDGRRRGQTVTSWPPLRYAPCVSLRAQRWDLPQAGSPQIHPLADARQRVGDG